MGGYRRIMQLLANLTAHLVQAGRITRFVTRVVADPGVPAGDKARTAAAAIQMLLEGEVVPGSTRARG